MSLLLGRRKGRGEILKAERMLVRIERIDNPQEKLPAEYNENNRVHTRLKRGWREYYVVARAAAESRHIVLHIHKNRRIPATTHTRTGKSSRWEIHLDPSNTRVSLFSPLDKTIAIVHPKREKGFLIFIFNCQSLQSSTQWFSFLRNILSSPPPEKTIVVTVPDLDNLQIQVKTYREGTSINDQEDAPLESTVISADEIVERCLGELRKSSRWQDVLDYWEKNFKMGLCWKRYDRIEWVTGNMASDDELASTWSLKHTHSLELRPKVHYPTQVRLGFEKRFSEPVPVEGFLVRLTAANGRQARFGKLFYKRLYFTSHDNLLFYCSPAKAAPPPPPKMLKMPNSDANAEETNDMPLIWASTPYKLKEGNIQWLEDSKSPREVQWYDEKAQIEYERCVQLVKSAEGFIDLSKVKFVRTVKRKPEGQDAGIGQGESVDFHAAELSTNDSEYEFEEGTASEFDDERAFELVLENGLIVRLQSYNKETRREWMRRLRDLIRYWKLRLAEDINSLKEMRAQNLKMVGIDQGFESRFGDWIRRYQLIEAVTAPGMYHFCRLSNCRTISMRGSLYAKFRRRQTFHNFIAVLTSQTLIIYEQTARSIRGIAQPRIHHKKARSIDLRHCYVYSGLMVESELVYQTTTLDPHLGYRVLPKMYKDGWTSVDDDLSCAFVVWHGQRRFAFQRPDQLVNSGEAHKVARVGLPGDIVVFMARSRLERDMWVSALGQEISRHASTVGEKLSIQ